MQMERETIKDLNKILMGSTFLPYKSPTLMPIKGATQDGEIPQFWNLYISVPVFKIELKYLIFLFDFRVFQ